MLSEGIGTSGNQEAECLPRMGADQESLTTEARFCCCLWFSCTIFFQAQEEDRCRKLFRSTPSGC
jgi:hypothetical protein